MEACTLRHDFFVLYFDYTALLVWYDCWWISNYEDIIGLGFSHHHGSLGYDKHHRSKDIRDLAMTNTIEVKT